jgi:hypothetical protein
METATLPTIPTSAGLATSSLHRAEQRRWAASLAIPPKRPVLAEWKETAAIVDGQALGGPTDTWLAHAELIFADK